MILFADSKGPDQPLLSACFQSHDFAWSVPFYQRKTAKIQDFHACVKRRISSFKGMDTPAREITLTKIFTSLLSASKFFPLTLKAQITTVADGKNLLPLTQGSKFFPQALISRGRSYFAICILPRK